MYHIGELVYYNAYLTLLSAWEPGTFFDYATKWHRPEFVDSRILEWRSHFVLKEF